MKKMTSMDRCMDDFVFLDFYYNFFGNMYIFELILTAQVGSLIYKG